ncbi:MAG: serine hydroxymethyltransferase [Chloroflexi bacterium]|jgi:glycine hydroxymethyltransferase|nr:serine hydroxymethyltransferase [Chloroflexota bacterium]MBT7082394.1 serine hydroxymethyltransferase [Chloroflexota bacterium]MBT7290634.1 serine hydroxymethyltransferase [Chloroflexota bacterium]
MSILEDYDPEVYKTIRHEEQRLHDNIELIASENYASKAVLKALGSVLNNKYAEGYPHKRYYGGCEAMDEIEELATKRARELFKADHANVQPHSGAQANMSAFFALCKPGDKIMGMSLAQGGHLTHGSPVNFSGQLYNFIPYSVNRDSEQLDYDEIERIAKANKPKVILAGATAYSRIIDFQRFAKIAESVGAMLMVDMAHIAGIVAAGLHPSPVPHAAVVTSTTHKTLRGPRSGFILCKSNYASAIDKAVFPGIQGGPLMHAIAARAVAYGEAMKPDFIDYQSKVLKNAVTLADSLQKEGLRIVSGGTDNHMMLVDLTKSGVTGDAAEKALDKVGITTNKNAIPFDPQPPTITSGIRLGTPAVTSRGFGSQEMKQIATLIVRVLTNVGDSKIYDEVKQQVCDITGRFPVPGITRYNNQQPLL